MDKIYIIGRDELPSLMRLQNGEKLRLTFVALPGVCAELALEVDIDGENCDVDIAGVYICSAKDKLSLRLTVKHNSGGSVSRQLFKGIVSDEARAEFDGLIYVASGAQKSKAYQANHSILLSDKAKAESRPQLEIYADDVECSHGSTSGFLNEDERFYMRSRGVTEKEALYLQKLAFIAPILARLPEELAEEINSCI